MKLTRIALSASLILTSTVHGLRGVSKENEQLYKPDEDGNWKCLNNPEIVLSFDKVNDDYCDCPDGSDEPGTSACSGVHQGGFYCENKGHIAGILPLNRVDDGVCDYDICCDGSDEKEGVCANKCQEFHDKHMKIINAQQEVLEKGLKEREKLVERAAHARDEQQKEVVKKEKELDDKRKFLTTRQELLKKLIAEHEEKTGNGDFDNDDGETPEAIENIASELDKLSSEYNEISTKLSLINSEKKKLDGILQSLKSDYNPNFNDPAVKDAIKSWEEIKGNSKVSENDDININTNLLAQLTKQLREYRDESAISAQNKNSFKHAGPIFKFLALFIPSSNHQLLAEYLYEGQLYLARQGLTAYPAAEHPGSGQKDEKTEPPVIRDARQTITNLEKEIDDIQASIQTILIDLSSDYGTDDVLRALRNVCIENLLGEYNYEVCFFGQASQKNSGSNTNLGTYSSIRKESDHLIMTFENGAKCWNGPVRRAQVELYCGATPQITTVSEPEKCEYFFKMTHPAACDPNSKTNNPLITHNDL